MVEIQWFGTKLGMPFKFYVSVAKRFELKFRKFWGLISTFVEVTGEKLVGGPFGNPSRIRLSILIDTAKLITSKIWNISKNLLTEGRERKREIASWIKADEEQK